MNAGGGDNIHISHLGFHVSDSGSKRVKLEHVRVCVQLMRKQSDIQIPPLLIRSQQGSGSIALYERT